MVRATLPLAVRDWLTETFAQFPLKCCIDCWGKEQIWLGCTNTKPVSPLVLQIHHPGVIRALLQEQDPLVLAEAHLNGLFDFSGRVEDLILLGRHLASAQIRRSQGIMAWLQSLTLPCLPTRLQSLLPWQNLQANSRERAQAVIQHHYDVGDEFYKLWLDPLMVYSCAHFDHPQMSLPEAQESKLDLICRKLRLTAGESLLDVGCGWGALLHWAVTHYGVKGYGITLSKEQLAFNQRRIAEEGLEDKLKVELLDYRDLPQQPTFNKIVSVGMIEHVAALKNYPVYFQRLLSSLKPGGLFLNHGIAASTEWHGTSVGERFVNRYIFPDGELVKLSATLTEMEKAGWEIVDVDAWRPHYAKTLRHWAANLEQASAQASALIGHQRVQLWRLYLLGSALAFEENQMGIFQVLLRQRADADWNLPLTRLGWLCKNNLQPAT